MIMIIAGNIFKTDITGADLAFEYDSTALFMLVPVIVTVIVAVNTGDIIIATTIGIVLAGLTGAVTGQFDFLQIDLAENVNALFSVSEEGLERTVGGIIYTGLSGMLQVSILALLLFGSISIMRQGGGDVRLLDELGKIAKSPAGAEIVISVMVILLSSVMGLNAPAILAVGASFAKPLFEKYEISPYRAANLLDAQSNTLVYALPWTPAIIFTIGFAAQTETPL